MGKGHWVVECGMDIVYVISRKRVKRFGRDGGGFWILRFCKSLTSDERASRNSHIIPSAPSLDMPTKRYSQTSYEWDKVNTTSSQACSNELVHTKSTDNLFLRHS